VWRRCRLEEEQAPGREVSALLGWTTSGGLPCPPSVGAAASGTAVLARPLPAPRNFDWPGAASRSARTAGESAPSNRTDAERCRDALCSWRISGLSRGVVLSSASLLAGVCGERGLSTIVLKPYVASCCRGAFPGVRRRRAPASSFGICRRPALVRRLGRARR
jgi:hypothetical protein